jgi:hypothetical protein
MTSSEWKAQWARLNHLHVSAETDRGKLSGEWFAQLAHHHVEAVEHGITQLIGGTKDNFLPGLGLLKDHIQTRFDKYQRTDGKCQTCHGSTWIDSAPFKSNGMIYRADMRCPDCGVPQPNYNAPSNRQPLTHREFAEFRLNDHDRQYMPIEQRAKHPNTVNPEMKAQAEKLRVTLFGKDAA